MRGVRGGASAAATARAGSGRFTAIGGMRRQRVYAVDAALFATVMLVVLALIARDGVSGATDRVVFGIQLALWSVVMTAFPAVLRAALRESHPKPHTFEADR